jgi:hypothetical protein
MRRYLPWLICFLILRGLAYILITPPWQAPDETTHFQFMELLTHRSLSEIRKIEQKTADEDYFELERRILESMKKHDAWKNKNISTPDPLPKRFREATFYSTSPPKIYRPPLYYLLGAGFLRLFDSQDLETRLYIARLYSLILTLTTVIVSFFIGTLAFQNEREALMTGVFVSCLPQFMVIGTSVNSDNLVNLLASGFLLYAVFLLHDQKRDLYLLPIPFFLLATLFSSKTGIIMVPVAVLLYIYRIRNSKESGVVLILTLMILASSVLLIQYLWSGMVTRAWQILKVSYDSIHFDLAFDWEFYLFFFIILFRSFWFVGGWMAIPWPHWVYAVVGILTIISTAGYFKYLSMRLIRRKVAVLLPTPILLLMSFAALLAFGVTFFYYGFVVDVFAQGRYLFPVLPAFAVLFILGLKTLCPKKMVSYLPHAFVIFMVCIDFYSLVGRLFPYFHLR